MAGGGDRERKIFEILVRENAAMLTVYLRATLADASAVDDLFQETMLVAWRRLDECDQTRPFGPWLRGIARNLVMAHHRARGRDAVACDQAVLDHLEHQAAHIASRPGDTWEEKTADLRLCIGALPETYRLPVEMRYLRGDSADAVATGLGVSLETVKKRLQRARALLLECIHRRGLLAEHQP